MPITGFLLRLLALDFKCDNTARPIGTNNRAAAKTFSQPRSRSMHDKVDVLIIGSGASGAAVAWSLAETQDADPLPRAGRLGEADRLSRATGGTGRRGCSAISPSTPTAARGRPTIRSTTPTRRSRSVNFNGVGGSTIMYTAHFPRLHPSDFRVRTLDGVADDWPVDYATLEPYFAENDRMMGVSGLAGDPGLSAARSRRCRRCRSARSASASARAMNQLGWHWWPSDFDDRHHRLRGPRALHQSRPLHAGLRAGRQGQHRHHLLAARDPRRRRAAHALPGARDHDRRARAWRPARSTTTPRARSSSSRREMVIVACNGVGTPRLLLNSVSAQFPNGLANSSAAWSAGT